VTFIRRYPLVTFFVLACGLSWIQESLQTSVRSPKSLVYEAQSEAQSQAR
jgi:hypothetical protein